MKIYIYILFVLVSFLSSAFAAAPTSSSSSLTYTNVTGNQMTLNWTSGNGAMRIVVANQGSAVSFTPTDGVDYASYQSLGSGQVVVYKGAASGFNFTTMGSTSLAVNTTYYFAIYEYNGTGTGTQFLVSPNLTGSQSTLAIASKPTAPVTSVTIVPFQGTFNSLPQQRIGMSWAGQDGQRTMIIMRAGLAVDPTVLPVDGKTSYQWQGLANGQIVCYYGTGTSYTLKSDGYGNLSPGTTYYFLFATLNGDGSTSSYLTSSYYATSSQTLSNAPTVNASNLTFSNIQTNQITLNWTSGNGANRIIVAKQGSAVTFVPSNGTSYALNTSLGSGEYVVYNGSGSTYTLSSGSTPLGTINSSTNYYFAIYEYNGTGSGSNYYTPALTGNQMTSAATAKPTVPSSSLVFSNVQTNQMTLTWTPGNGSGRIVIMRKSSAVSVAPVDGTTYSNYQSLGSGNSVMYNGSGNTFTFANDGYGPLSPSTTYYFAIFEYNGSGSTISYLTASNLTGNQTTSGLVAKPTTASSSLFFTNVHSYQMTLNWTNGNGAARMIIMNQGSPVSFTPVDGTTYSAYQSVGSGNLVLYNGSASAYTASNDGYGPLAANTSYYFAIFEYNGSAAQISYLTSSYLSGNQTTLISGRLGHDNSSTDLSAAELKVYPVPATSFVNITVNGNQVSQELLFYSYSGDLVNRMFVPTGTPVQLDLSSWNRGLYFVKSSNENGDLIQKIILQ